MKKNIFKSIIGLVSCFLLILVAFNMAGCKDTHQGDEKLTTIRLGEVTHSAFYAPLYVAIENGYFEENGIKIDLSLISGANNVTAAVLSGDIDVGFCGPEATIYIYNGGEDNYIQTFAGLTKRDGQFIVSRKNLDNFTWDMLEGKRVLAGRSGALT